MAKTNPWNIKQIYAELRDGYMACNTETERQCWQAIAAKDCRRILDGREPTPGEQSILDSFGIRV